ncbi:hypothetical protein BGW42_008057 [Actinomortierella wolfii]|nr:hypothetical protein BGW42_008057 [Actinomortierella wolfii]
MSLTVSAAESSESPRTTSVERGTRVFTKRLQSPGVIHQACLGKWTLDCPENAVEVVFGKSSYLSLHRFTVDTPESTESHPTGRLELIHEQPVFGVIKDMKTIQCRFEPEVDDPTEDKELEGDQEMLEEPAIDTLPSTTTSDMLVCTSDSGDNYGQHQIATFHISLRKFRRTPSFQVGQSFVTSDDSLATMHMRALPHYPRALVYVDEEKITLVTIPKASPTTHNHHPPLYLLKREPSARELGEEAKSQESSKSHEEYPFISALAPSPGIALTDEQIIYLGSPTSEIYRIHLDTITNEMQYEMVSGERSVGKVMTVLAKQTFYREEEDDDMPGRMTSTLYSTDFLLYSNEQGDGGVLAIREDRDCVSPFAVETLQSDSPILDFSLREPSIPGRDCIYACSGMREEGSLLRIRSGIATESSGSSSNPYFAGTVGMWAFALKEADDFDSFLVISFVQSTKVMFNGEEGSLEDISEKSGFILNHSTLFAGRIQDGAIFQVHREGVLVVWPDTGRKYIWQCSGEIVTAADLVAPGVIVLGMVTETNQSSLKVLQLSHTEDSDIPGTFETIAETSLREELTTIYCWSSTPHAEYGQEVSTTRYCCIGTLEPSLVVFKLEDKRIREVYRESLAINATQKQREHVTIPQALCIVEAPAQPNADPHKRSYKMLVGLRDGTMLAYGWHPATSDMPSESPKMLSLPQLFKIGILPVKFVTRPCSSSSLHPNVLPTAVLVIADGIWKAQMKSSRLEIDTVLFDREVTHACSFHYYGPDSEIASCFAFVVNHNDLQIVTVGKHKEFNHHPSIMFGETPRRLLDITSKKLMLVATVGNKFPADESRLRLIDPDTPLEVAAETTSEEHDEEQAPVTSEFRLKKGEMVCCMVEWKVSKANKADAVYICIGTAQFSTTDDKSSLGIPKAGRLVAFSIKQNKKAERKDQRYELEQRWSMPMQAPVYAVAPLLDK